MTDKIKIGVGLDTKEAEKQIDNLQKKIKAMRETGPGGAVSQLSQQYKASGQDEKAKRLEDFRNRANAQQRKGLISDLKTQESELSKQLKKYEDIGKLQKKLVDGGKAYNQSLAIQAQSLTKISTLTKQISEGKKLSGDMSRGSYQADYGRGMGGFSGRDMEFMRRGMGGGRGIRGGLGAMGRVMSRNPTMAMGMAGTGLAAAGAAVKTMGNVGFHLGTSGEREVKAEAGVSGMLSEVGDLQMRGRQYEMDYFGQERMRAIGKSQNRIGMSKGRDTANIIGGGLGMAGGALAGAAIGSIIPGIGTAIGAGIGGLYGAWKGGGQDMLTDDTQRSKMFDGDFYNKIKTQEGAGVVAEQMEAEKKKSWDKTLANDFYQKNSSNFRKQQRAFGMSDEDLFKGEESLFKKATRAGGGGFNMATTTRNMEAISAGGGSSQMAKDPNAVILASQMERGMNLTNAGNLLGKIGGATGGDTASSEDKVVRMMAEATKIGLDTSDYAKETRTFLQTAADMAYSQGGDQGNIANLLGMGTGLKTDRGIAASKNALDIFKGQTGEMGGLTGQYQIGGLNDDEFKGMLGEGKSMGSETEAMIMGMDITKISKEDEFLQSTMRKLGVKDKDKFIEKIRKEKSKASLTTGSQESSLEALSKGIAGGAKGNELMDLMSAARESINITDQGFNKLAPEEQKSLIRQKAMTAFPEGHVPTDIEKRRAEFEKDKVKDTKLIGDAAEKQDATGQADLMGNLTVKYDELYGSMDKVKEGNLLLSIALKKLTDAAAGPEDVFNAYKAMYLKIQGLEEITGPSTTTARGNSMSTNPGKTTVRKLGAGG